MNTKTFKNLNLFTVKYPFTAIISILHRLSGIFIFLLIPFLLWLLDEASLTSVGFDHIKMLLHTPGLQFLLWVLISAFWYHLFAGIRHLIMDIGWGESLRSARVSGAIVLILTLIFIILTGMWIW